MRHLKEWVDKDGNEIKLKSTASKASTPTVANTISDMMPNGYFKSRFKKIFNHMVDIYRTCRAGAEISDLDLVVYYKVAGKGQYRLLVTSEWNCYPLDLKYERVTINGTRELIAKETFYDYNELLDKLLALGVIKDKKLCESYDCSAVEEFKLYENLWG